MRKIATILIIVLMISALCVLTACSKTSTTSDTSDTPDTPDTPATYVLQYASNDAAMGTVTSSIAAGSSIAADTSVSLTATAATGYTFDGWYEGDTQASTQTTYTFDMPARALTLEARFSATRYALSVNIEDATMGSVTSNITTDTVASGTLVTLTATANTGYDFVGWYKGATKVSADATYTFEMPAADRSLVAKFALGAYELFYDSEDDAKGSATSSVTTATVAYGTSVTLTATANPGYAFDGWYEGVQKVSDQAAYTFAMPASDRYLVAKFASLGYVLSYSVATPGTAAIQCAVDSNTAVLYGTSVTLTATANTGYAFEGWYEGVQKVSDQAAYTFVMPARALVLQARTTLNSYTLTYASADADMGRVQGNVSSGSDVDYLATVNLVATPETGHRFVGWYEGDLEVANTAIYSFDMPAASRTLEARFAVESYILTYDVDDADKGSIDCARASGTALDYGTSVILTAVPAEGYDFDGWYVGSQKVESIATYAFDLRAATALVARFVVQKRTVNFYSGTDLVDTQSVDYNTRVVLPSVTKPNYNFVGWYEDRAFEHLFDERAITVAINLYARWEAAVVYYDVRFLDWDDTQVGATQQIEQGHAAILPANPTRTGYVFAGWTAPTSYTAVTADVDVRATYTKQQFTVTFYLGQGDTVAYRTQTVDYLDCAVLPPTPIDEDNLFAGWYYNDYLYDFTLPVDEALDLYATWTPKPVLTHTVTFYDGADEDKQVVDVQVIEDGASATAPASPAKVGKIFAGWDIAFDAVTTDLDVHATYNVATYTVTFAYYDGDVYHEDDQVVAHGTAATVPASYQRTGYTFAGWDVAFDAITADVDVTAQYTIKTFTATYYNGTQQLGEEQADYGATFAVPATPTVPGYSFIGWYADDQFAEAFDFTAPATADVGVYAKFAEIVLRSYTVNFLDWDGALISTQTVVEGNAAIDPGTPTRTGYTFSGWDKAFDNVVALTEVTAQYEVNHYTVTYLEADRGTEIGRQSVSYRGDASSLAAPNDVPEGYHFVRWSQDITSVTRDVTVYAVIAADVRVVYFVEVDGTELSRQNVAYGSTASVPATPAKVGCIFVGWYVDADLEVAYDFNTPVTDADGTYIYAKWEEASGVYAVYFKDFDGAPYGNVQRIVAGYYVEEPADPVKEGMVFDGWYIEGTDTLFDFDMAITRSITLVARGHNA